MTLFQHFEMKYMYVKLLLLTVFCCSRRRFLASLCLTMLRVLINERK